MTNTQIPPPCPFCREWHRSADPCPIVVTAGKLDERLAQLQADHVPAGERLAERRRRRRCGVLGCELPGVALLPRGRRCTDHQPAQPVAGYCAPARCYCDSDSCRRPA